MSAYAVYYEKIPAHLKRVNGFSEDYRDLPLHQKAFIEQVFGLTTEWVITLPDGRQIHVQPQLQLDPASKGV